ncbi:aminotransferase class V-fold PLP-dependent enzyme [Bifidobacterium sp.]|uniref:aminotransferase class V-fold PLP-dependent enzyme n=1 Tax=Bifidobacterium sp. TaxID=41200 RepID=UPI0025C6C62E|nr:aminotransferase class V-fold PLP-dependent enzyme [Bifidobacterium sp.]MCH4209739.1 aminotransferase class V-fold PLP-dependent enzyme [Bifidobacterium sp.]MCI1224901.1 aminotransferase class V-fold PLP-dependent enzyme [Bifidobacterium sp.]
MTTTAAPSTPTTAAAPIVAPAPMLDIHGRPAAQAWQLATPTLHINHGSFGAVPTQVLAYQADLKAQMESSPVKWFIAATGLIKESRRKMAALLGTSEENMSFVPNASAGATVVLNSMEFGPGDEILVSNHGYGAVVMGAERKIKAAGGILRTAHIPINATADDIVSAFEERLSSCTKLVITDEITSPTAMLFPVKRIAELAHRYGARVLIDGAHAPGLIREDPLDLGADYWIGNLHKFVCCPRGCAMLIVSTELAQGVHPLINSWGRDLPYPERFDMQGTLDQTSYLCAPYTYEYIENTFGWDRARQYIQTLADYGQELIAAAFEKETGENHHVDYTQRAPGMRLVRLPKGIGQDHDSDDMLRDRVSAAFDVETAFTSFDGIGYLRLSSFIYNTAADYQRFADECVPALCQWAKESA